MKLTEFNNLLKDKINDKYYDKCSIYYNSLECGYEDKFYISCIFTNCETEEDYEDTLTCHFVENEVLIYKELHRIQGKIYKKRICDFEFDKDKLELE